MTIKPLEYAGRRGEGETGSPELGGWMPPSYQGPPSGVHPPLDTPAYRSALLRAPRRPPVLLPHGLTEVTGPLLGEDRAVAADAELTTRHAGAPLGERIIVTGRVRDSDGRPVPGTLIEIWQANAAGRYAHKIDDHLAPLDPELRRGGPLPDRFRGQVPVRHDQAGRLPVGQPPQRVAAPAPARPEVAGASRRGDFGRLGIHHSRWRRHAALVCRAGRSARRARDHQ